MNLPPRKPKFSIPVSGARVGSVARPVEDGAVDRQKWSAGDQPTTGFLPKPRFGLRAHASALRVGPVVDEPTGPILPGDHEVA